MLFAAPAGCATTTTSQTSAVATTGAATEAPPASTPAPDASPSPLAGAVLLIERGDLRLGTTVQFSRIPTGTELYDLVFEPGLARVLIALDHWPAYEDMQSLDRAPEGVEIVAVLPGFPPTRAAADAWDYVQTRVRIIVVVDGPPDFPSQIENLNSMRGLERVIARMAEPSRDGFLRLQRPLSFLKVMP